jgi:hypothetical protein
MADQVIIVHIAALYCMSPPPFFSFVSERIAFASLDNLVIQVGHQRKRVNTNRPTKPFALQMGCL